MTTRFRQSVSRGAAVSSLESVSVVAGLPRSSRDLKPGPLPLGATMRFFRRNRFCPPPSSHGQFLFQLFAMPAGFADPDELRTPEVVEALFDAALAHGALRISYGVS